MTVGNDDLSDAELAYLESGGKHTDGLPAADTSGPSLSDPGVGSPPPSDGLPAPTAGQDGASEDDDETDEVEVVTSKDGRTLLKGKGGKFVSHKALHSEREKHKSTKAERDELKLKLARGEERLAILNEVIGTDPKLSHAQPQQPANALEEADIDPEKDFMGWAKQVQRRNIALSQQLQATRGETQTRETLRSVKEVYHNDAKQLMAADPNFEGAYRHLVAGRHRELQFMGMTDEAERSAYIAQEETALVTQALQQGQRPAQVVYEMAKARGFVPNAAQAQNGQQHNANPQLAAAQQKIAAVKNGQQAAQTLSQAGSGSSEGLTFASLANMSDEEFARAVDGMSKAQQERFLGR